jgi:hypothetical protein
MLAMSAAEATNMLEILRNLMDFSPAVELRSLTRQGLVLIGLKSFDFPKKGPRHVWVKS